MTNVTICEISPLRPFSSHHNCCSYIHCASNSVEVRRREEIRTPAIFIILHQLSSVGILAGNSLYFRETEIKFSRYLCDFATGCSTATLPRGREYWMLHRGPGFLAAVWFGSSPSFSPLSICNRDRRYTGRPRKRDNLLMLTGDRGGGGGRGAESCDRKKAWPSINHSILSDQDNCANSFFVLYKFLVKKISARVMGKTNHLISQLKS